MLNLRQLDRILTANPKSAIHLMLPDGDFVPAHFHVTEVGRVHKQFVDCGGTKRESLSCLLQVWTADDVHHRLDTTKLGDILRHTESLFRDEDPPVEVEYESGVISQYPVGGVEMTPAGLLLTLGTKHTECLAPDKCGVGGTGCC
ncbi:DUF6428 family protein [Zavarzinella formosa]|uniref:DUF6428 family protein n=1 Tax=Zavarzinella formosa TaxID=360055 RepID=UPI0003117F8C|nr:DUF6428 family protein [Zavarzinella formosa]